MAACLLAPLRGQTWQPPTADALRPPARADAPLLACTADELARLRAELAERVGAGGGAGGGPGSGPVASRVARARKRLGEPLAFPPRGGQHNQWYQCEGCQSALTTVDPTHHRCARCGKVYSGPPYDDVVFARQHADNLARGREAAWAYALTGETAFADAAAAVLRGYADRYEAYPYHSNDRNPATKRDSGGHLNAQTLTEASLFVTDVAPALDLVWPALPAEVRTDVLAHLVRPLVENVAKCRRGKSNWQSWHNAALFAGGMLLGDAELVQRSILDPKNGFLFQMDHCVSREGMWFENSFGYHLYTLSALVQHAAAAQRAGIDLCGHPVLQRMATLPARYLLADGHLPRLGDDVDSTLERALPNLEVVYAYAHTERLRAVLPSARSWEAIQFGREQGGPEQGSPEQVGRTDGEARAPADLAAAAPSEVLADAGHAILRRPGWQASALLTFAPFGGFHDHFDRLSFVWHARGRERGLDPGRAASQAYRLPIHAGWYRATLAHDTVVVDGRSQAGARAELLGFVRGDGFDAVAARSTGAYPGVEHRRCLVLTDRGLIVLDRLTSARAHTFDWLYHDRSVRVDTATARAEPEAPLGLAGEEFVTWLHAGATEAEVAVTFADDEAGNQPVCALRVAAGGPTAVRTGTGPFRSTADRAPFVLLRREGTAVAFAALLTEPDSVAGGSTSASSLRAEVDGDGMRVEATWGGATERYVWDGAGTVERQR